MKKLIGFLLSGTLILGGVGAQEPLKTVTVVSLTGIVERELSGGGTRVLEVGQTLPLNWIIVTKNDSSLVVRDGTRVLLISALQKGPLSFLLEKAKPVLLRAGTAVQTSPTDIGPRRSNTSTASTRAESTEEPELIWVEEPEVLEEPNN